LEIVEVGRGGVKQEEEGDRLYRGREVAMGGLHFTDEVVKKKRRL